MKIVSIFLASVLGATAVMAASFAVRELDDAHHSVDDAMRHMDEANAHHVDQFGGHEGKARELLAQARREIEEADRFFAEHHH